MGVGLADHVRHNTCGRRNLWGGETRRHDCQRPGEHRLPKLWPHPGLCRAGVSRHRERTVQRTTLRVRRDGRPSLSQESGERRDMSLNPNRKIRPRQRGTTLLEVLVTMLVLAFGMLGLAGLQAKMHLAEMESYQRAQAIVLLSDMVERINANRANAAAYVTGTATPLGTGDTQAASCTGTAIGVARDRCEWNNALKGAAETTGGASIGAMIGARGCVEQLQAPNLAPGVCTPGRYRVTVVWQGLNATATPSLACASAVS